ncbi:MAG: DUF4292 domain-containing protein [Bacteroidales bacterium]|nr:DUF4292 domain-containing protein [Bacteroidales bacterium]
MLLATVALHACRSRRTAVQVSFSDTLSNSCYSVGSITVSKCRWNVTEGGTTHRLRGSIYIRPDSICYFRGEMTVEVFRGIVLKDSFAIINRMDRVCYKGSNDYLSRIAGYPVNPASLCLLFTADRCEQAYRLLGYRIIVDNSRIVMSGRNASVVEMNLDTEGQTVEDMTVRGRTSGCKIAYGQYRAYPRFMLPTEVDIAIRGGTTSAGIHALFQDVRFDAPQTINFKIPDSYTIVRLE